MERDTTPASTQSLGPFSVVVHWHGYRGRPMTIYMLVVPLGAEAICRLELLPGWRGAYVMGKLSR
jgi:hypothetical protein